jgi:hypothetical protein
MEIENLELSSRSRWGLWFAAWGVIALWTLTVNPSHLLLAPFFPIGLLGVWPNNEGAAIGGWMLQLPIVLGWVFYLTFSVIMIKARKAKTFVILFIVFCILLVLNVGGCERTMEAVSHIE